MMAALALVRAADRLRLLQQVERATGRSWVTADDVRHVGDATADYTGAPRQRLVWKRRVR